MSSLIVQEFVTVDGFAADTDGEFGFGNVVTDWHELDADQLELLGGVGTIVLGRKTYELFVHVWPGMDAAAQPVAPRLNELPKAVFSKTLPAAPWGNWPEATVERGEIVDGIARLKANTTGNLLLWGSLALTRSLLREGLVDELRLIVCPVVLGAGIGVLPADLGTTPLTRTGTKAYRNGAVALTYSI